VEWECGLCGYIEDDEQPPANCPVCGAPKSRFSERYDDGLQGSVRPGKAVHNDLDEFEQDLFADFEE